MGLMHYFLGLEVWQVDGELFVSRGKYANKILQRFCMDSYKPMETPLAINYRKVDATSDMCYAINQPSQAMVRPTKLFWRAAKHVLRYLRGTTQFGLWYRQRRILLLRYYISTKKQEANILTKALSRGKFEFHNDDGCSMVQHIDDVENSSVIFGCSAETMKYSMVQHGVMKCNAQLGAT
eukprot:PITA_30696